MIVTVTLNTALGVRYQARQVVWDATNQVSGVSYHAAGRGIAVARVLHTFGHEVIPAGVAGGSPGALLSGDAVRAVTAAGQWHATLPTRGGPCWSRDALVAGLVPGVLLGWSWQDRLRHAVALGASASAEGEVDLVAYERLVGEVRVHPHG